MPQKKIKSSTDQRPFIIVYHDCLESTLFDNHYQIVVYIALKKFADSKNQCFPSLKKLSNITKVSKRKVQDTLRELEQKHIIGIESKLNTNGGKSSNLYTLYDFKELWSTDSNEKSAVVAQNDGIKPMTPAEHIAELERMGYKVDIKEKGLVSEPTKAHTQAPNNQNLSKIKNITAEPKCQAERYSIEQIKQLFDYDVMIYDNPYQQQNIDAVISILHTTLNTTKQTIRINGENKPAMVVIGKLMKLDKDSIMYAINMFGQQTEKVKNPIAYMLTILYNAPEQYNLDIQNQVQHDMAYWYDK